MKKEARISSIIKRIKEIDIQGARNIARAALYAYSIKPTKQIKEKLIKARPTEPMLVNTLRNFQKLGYNRTVEHFDQAQDKINELVFKIIKNNSVIFTHCHSTNVVNSLIYSKNHGKHFEVYNTETRPLFQGRKTARELESAGIKVTTFVDAAAGIALKREQGSRKTDYVFLGADAILKDGVINKVGSGMFSEIAFDNNIPVYIIADSWKYAKSVPLEERNFKEIWKRAPKHVKVKNLAFEKIPKKYIQAIVSEIGVLSLDKFAKKTNI